MLSLNLVLFAAGTFSRFAQADFNIFQVEVVKDGETQSSQEYQIFDVSEGDTPSCEAVNVFPFTPTTKALVGCYPPCDYWDDIWNTKEFNIQLGFPVEYDWSKHLAPRQLC